MKLVWILCLAAPVLAQVTFRTSASSMMRGPAPVAHAPQPHYRNYYRGGLGYGYWGSSGYWNTAQRLEAAPPPEPKAPVLASSSLYQADRANPVMREYGSLPAATVAPATVALVAFRDGRVEPVQAYWLEGDQFAFVTKADAVRKVPLTTVDAGRSESLNRQQGVEFKLR